MSLCVIKNISLEKSKKLVDTIYENFKHLTQYKELSHNKEELTRLVTDSGSKTLFIMVDNKLAAYLIGELKNINDGRRVFYVSYIYTAARFRRRGFASKLLAYVEAECKKFGHDGIMLTYDSEDDDVHHFYEMKGFMPDLLLRRYNKYEVLYKPTY